jgi:hypothetical protein
MNNNRGVQQGRSITKNRLWVGWFDGWLTVYICRRFNMLKTRFYKPTGLCQELPQASEPERLEETPVAG